MSHPLHNRWHDLCTRVGAFKSAHESDITFDMVVHLYEHPGRAYHNLDHIAQVLGAFDQAFRLADDRDLVEFSLWMHDCVYIAERPDNEDRSADAATMIAGLLGVPAGFADRVRQCIMATRHSSDPAPGDASLVADVDLSILSASASEYDHYRRAIRREFAFAEDSLFIQGRIAFLRRMLDKHTIYATRYFKATAEVPARANLARELDDLERAVLLL